MSLVPRKLSLADRVLRAEKRLRRLETRRSLGRATISEGDLTVKSGGAFRVLDDDGHVVAIIGALPSPDFDRADGSRQPGVALYREDQTLAAVLADLDPTTPPYKQAWQFFDRAGRIILADDTNSGHGLARPYVGGGIFLADTDVTRWPQTTNPGFTRIASGWYRAQNPRLSWDINMVCDAATAGEVKLLVNGSLVDSVQTVGTSFIDWYPGAPGPIVPEPLPAGVNVGDIVLVELMARRTSGTGSVFAVAQRFEGDQSP